MTMRTHHCGVVTTEQLETEVVLCGWVHRRRDHGGVIFIDLRDHRGLVQVVFDPDRADIFAMAEQVRNEFVLRVTGRVRNRPEGTINPDMATGEIEVLALDLEILNQAETPPFQLDDDDVSEENRMRFRYVDLRREDMQARMRMRDCENFSANRIFWISKHRCSRARPRKVHVTIWCPVARTEAAFLRCRSPLNYSSSC